MPAWLELQQRGLFADHGLAHDLVQDAVLAGMPTPIQRQLHRQIALHLEAQGLQGAAVLRHWIAADDADRALPHAVHCRHGPRALEGREYLLLDLLERASDAALIEHVWVTVWVHEWFALREWWDRLQRLVLRARPLSDAVPLQSWAAHETARILFVRDRRVRPAYEVLAPWAGRMAAKGTERAFVEALLVRMAFALGDPTREHTERFRHALEGGTTPIVLVQMYYSSAGLVMPISAAIRTVAKDLRAARRRSDRAMSGELREVIGTMYCVHGYQYAGSRHYVEYEKFMRSGHSDPCELPFGSALAAASVGRFDWAIDFLRSMRGPQHELNCKVVLADIWMRLGHHDRARSITKGVEIADLSASSRSALLAVRCVFALDERDGVDPLPNLKAAVHALRAAGTAPHVIDMIDWQIQSRTLPLDDRLTACTQLLASIKSQPRWLGNLADVLLDAAQTHAEAGSPAARGLALEAARLLRRRCTLTLHLPEATVRCAKLLEHSDPAEAASLRYVARRWVIQALPHVPEDCLHSYVYDVPIHRQLLGDDAEAVAAGKFDLL
jgi:hypothetical protein